MDKYFSISEDRKVDKRRNGERRTFEVQKMWNSHHEITRLALLGMKQADIARHLKISEAMVSYTLNSEVVKERLAIMKGARDAETVDLARDILELAPLAIKIYEKLLEEGVNGSPTALHKATADRVLDVSGFGPVKRIDARHAHLVGHFSAEDLEKIKEQGRKAAIEAGEMIVEQDT
jgi:predicted transcriptional regulator